MFHVEHPRARRVLGVLPAWSKRDPVGLARPLKEPDNRCHDEPEQSGAVLTSGEGAWFALLAGSSWTGSGPQSAGASADAAAAGGRAEGTQGAGSGSRGTWTPKGVPKGQRSPRPGSDSWPGSNTDGRAGGAGAECPGEPTRALLRVITEGALGIAERREHWLWCLAGSLGDLAVVAGQPVSPLGAAPSHPPPPVVPRGTVRHVALPAERVVALGGAGATPRAAQASRSARQVACVAGASDALVVHRRFRLLRHQQGAAMKCCPRRARALLASPKQVMHGRVLPVLPSLPGGHRPLGPVDHCRCARCCTGQEAHRGPCV